MVEFNNKIRILFFIWSMILTVQALEISILNVLSDFKCKTEIITKRRTYNGLALKSYYYEAFYQNSTVIAYFVNETRFEEIACPDAFGIRMGIAQELGRNNHEIVVFGIKKCQDNEYALISGFLDNIIKPHPNRTAFKILIMGEEPFVRIHRYLTLPFAKYKEKSQIFNGTMQKHLRRSFPKMTYRYKGPDSRNIREVRFFENPKYCTHEYPGETRWPVFVQHGEYFPAPYIDFSEKEHNIMRRNRKTSAHILVVSGKDYIRLTTEIQYPNRNPWLEEMKKVMDKMINNNEILYIMGFFNFDWSEIGLVTQIILTHSKVPTRNLYNNSNIFTAGMGMFDTFFHNPNKAEKIQLQQSTNNDLMEFIKNCQGGTMRKKTIELFNLNATNVISTTYEIVLSNGRYEMENHPLISQYSNTRFAFIVIDSTEMHDQNVFSVAQTHPYVKMLQNNGIELFIIKLNNFELYDLHIVPEWIESIRGAVPPTQITLLGAGSCNTIFQISTPGYQITYTQLNVANELKEFRKAFVATAERKRIILANINVPNCWIQTIPMHTINGFYDPVVISESYMIPTPNNTRILFLVMNADKFINMINAVREQRPTLITNFRQRIASYYPLSQWMVYLVGLDNFTEKDFHLFAECVKTFTIDGRLPQEFLCTFGDGIYQTMYEFRESLPFYTATEMPMADVFIEFFNAINEI